MREAIQISPPNLFEGGSLHLPTRINIDLKWHLKSAENWVVSHIRECGSTLYVGMAHPAPPTNTNFQISFLLTQLREAFYEDLPV